MSDNTGKSGTPDRIRINMKQKWERRHWTLAFGVTQQCLRASVKAVGPMVKDVKAFLIAKIRAA